VRGGKAPNPIREWKEAAFFDRIMDCVYDAGFDKPTPIQMQAIPIANMKKDMIALAPTGSGKTAAYILPLVNFLLRLPPV